MGANFLLILFTSYKYTRKRNQLQKKGYGIVGVFRVLNIDNPITIMFVNIVMFVWRCEIECMKYCWFHYIIFRNMSKRPYYQNTSYQNTLIFHQSVPAFYQTAPTFFKIK